MALSWIARALAALALLAWLLEDFAIAAAGGPGKSGLEHPFFRAGLVAYLLGAAAIGGALASARKGEERLLAALAAVAVAVAGALILRPVAASVLAKGWFADRVGYLVAVIVLLILSWSAHAVRRRRKARLEQQQAETAEQVPDEPEEPPAT